MNEPDLIETELKRLRPAKLPEDFAARLEQGLVHKRAAPSPQQRKVVRGLSVGGLLRWLTPVGVTAAILMFLAARHFSWFSAKSPSGASSVATGTSLKADEVEINRKLLATFDAVTQLPNGEPVRFRCSQWLDDMVVRDSAHRVSIEQRSPRLEVIPVRLEVY